MNQPKQGQDSITPAMRRFQIEIAPDHYERDNDAIEENRADNIRAEQQEQDDAKGEQP